MNERDIIAARNIASLSIVDDEELAEPHKAVCSGDQSLAELSNAYYYLRRRLHSYGNARWVWSNNIT